MKTSSPRVTLREMYLGYTYKWRDVNSTTVPIPYFSKSEITNHSYSMEFKEWKKVIRTYLELLMEYLLTGLPLSLPQSLGYIQMKKYKGQGINHKRTKEVYGKEAYKNGKIIKYKNIHTNGYKPIIKWYRQNARLSNKWLWRFNLLETTWKKVSKRIDKNLTLINNFSDV